MISRIAFGLLIATTCFAGTWEGEISDSACGASHNKMMSSHADLKTARDCTQACIKSGAKYVFVTEGKVYKIDNQTFADLAKQAGEKVKLTGDLKGDTVTVTKIAKP